VKKLVLSLISAGVLISTHSFALTSECGNCGYSSGLCAPKNKGGLYAGITGYYVSPRETALGQITDSWQYLDANQSTRAQSKPFTPDRDWGWGVNVGYDFPCTAYGIEFDYFKFNNKTHAINNLLDNPASFASIFFPSGVFPIGTDADLTSITSNAYLRYQYNQADLKVTRQFNGCGFQLQPAIGVRYANLEHRLTFSSPATLTIPGDMSFINFLFDGEVKSKFDGAGPLLTLDANYGLGCGFGIAGRFEGALIAGQITPTSFIAPTTVTTTSLSPSGTARTVTTTNHTPKTDRLVTNVGGKLGLNYSYCFCNRSSVTLEVGYQAAKYYDAVDIIQGSFNTPEFRVTGTTTENLTITGPYANLTCHL